MRGGTPARRVAAAGMLALALVAVACTGDDAAPPEPPDGGSPGTTIPGVPGTLAPTGWDGVTVDDSALSLALGPTRLTLRAAPFTFAWSTDDGPLLAQGEGSARGLYVVRDGGRSRAVSATWLQTERSGASAQLTYADGTTAVLTLSALTPGTIAVRLAPDDPTGVTAWGLEVETDDREAIYGLTERVVDDKAASEWFPGTEGTLDRKGETVTMYVTPTISGYAPFHQSSRGYGLLVEGTMPGTYDLGATDPTLLSLEFELSPGRPAGAFDLLYGPSHPEILRQHALRTCFPPQPPDEVFLHWRGKDVYPVGEPRDWRGVAVNPGLATDLAAYDRYGIPPGVFHFDRPWAVGTEGYGDFLFDRERFPNAEPMLAAMEEAGWATTVWVSPWLLDGAGEEARQKGYLAPNSERALDVTDDEAVAWQQDRLVAFLTGAEGRYVDGLFLDRGDEPDVTSTEADVYADGRTGREIHNAYPVLYAQAYREAMDRARPDGDGFLITRPAYTGSQCWTMRWGGDTPSREGITVPEVPNTNPSTDKGLRSVLVSMQRAAFLGTPYWGSDIGGYSPWIDRDVYARWIQVGALSPLMRFHGQGGTPWEPTPGSPTEGTVDTELLTIYQRYVELHHALSPYLVGLAREAASTGNTLVRPLVFTWPDEAGALDRWDQWTLGPDLLVAPVWESGARSRTVWIPPGTWIDAWTRAPVTGPTEITVDAPLDTLPLWIRQGSELGSLDLP